jgi:hypothetical protein
LIPFSEGGPHDHLVPYFGLPDSSPFVTKAVLLLKFAGLAFEENRSGFAKAPKQQASLYRRRR